MHPRVYEEFERICSERKASGSILEVGAVPSTMSLLCMKSLANATGKIGLNLNGPYEFRDFKIVKGNANSMDCFQDNSFHVVLCNALLEHDKYFWRTISEIKRVAKSGALIVIGTPGYQHYKVEKIKAILRRIPLMNRLRSFQFLNLFLEGTVTFEIHDYPGDYYRFSPQTFKEVFLEGLDHVEVRSILLPPRIIGAGVKR